MKKTVIMLIVILLALPNLVTYVAADEIPAFSFVLTADGEEIKEVETGDVITVALRLRRTDEEKVYMMYAMQDEIRYDGDFFEFVEGSAVLNNGIVATDIAMVDHFKEFYMNFLSMTGGMEWDPDRLIGTFQLRVVGTSGTTQISNEDFLVSVRDGSESYPCEGNVLTIIVSTDCVVQFRTNGGSLIEDQIVQFGERIVRPEDPVRDGYDFSGWYKDIYLSEEWDFETDVVQGNMSLYAKWVEAAPADLGTSAGESVCWLWWLLLLLIAGYAVKRYMDKAKDKKEQ